MPFSCSTRIPSSTSPPEMNTMSAAPRISFAAAGVSPPAAQRDKGHGTRPRRAHHAAHDEEEGAVVTGGCPDIRDRGAREARSLHHRLEQRVRAPHTIQPAPPRDEVQGSARLCLQSSFAWEAR